MEKVVSTIEIPDIDINARFTLPTDMIEVKPAGPFLYEVIIKEGKKGAMDKFVQLMQCHPNKNVESITQLNKKSIQKSYVKIEGTHYLSSHVARWQLLGVIAAMDSMGMEIDQSSRMAKEVGLENGVYNVMVYDSMVCRRGILRKDAFKNLIQKRINRCGTDHKAFAKYFLDYCLCFFPSTGVQVDYTAG